MKNSIYQNKALRLLIGIGLPLLCALMLIVFGSSGKTPPCFFYEVTGLYCVGCGAGRCLLSLLRGNIYAAFRYQPLLFITLPFLCAFVAKIYISFVFGKDILPLPAVKNRWVGITIAALIIAFWVLRNIPFPPFSYLAPTAV